jgi:hypothetical protein
LFFIDAINRVLLSGPAMNDDSPPAYYLIRLLGYGLIVYAILGKTCPGGR